MKIFLMRNLGRIMQNTKFRSFLKIFYKILQKMNAFLLLLRKDITSNVTKTLEKYVRKVRMVCKSGENAVGTKLGKHLHIRF